MPNWRRSAASWQKCGRSLWTPAPAASGIGTQLVDELRQRARRDGYERLCVLTHAPEYFIHMGFSIVPHLWVQEKIFTDCVNCPKFRTCGQFAMVVALETLGSERPGRGRRRPPLRMTLSVPTVIELTAGGVTAPKGFRAAGVSAGIKANGGLDLALLVSDRPATAAAVFTTNRAQAAPVLVSREHLSRSGGVAQAIVANSGCANACTGDDGIEVARGMAAETARLVGCPVEQVLVASTGVIGVNLSLDKIRTGLPDAFQALDSHSGPLAARAIMTTDPFPKESAIHISIGSRDLSIGGMAKGSGMIEPMMATMLAFVTTDAAVAPPLLDARAPRSRRRYVQRHYRRRRVLDQRLRDAPRQWRERRHHRRDQLRRVRTGPRDRMPAPRPGHRARRRGRHQAHHHYGHRCGQSQRRAARRRR